MVEIEKKIFSHAKYVDSIIMLEDSTSKTLEDWLSPLIHSVTSDGAIPYLIDRKERYRASPLASLLIWMDLAKLIPQEIITIFNDRLFYLRDYHQDGDPDKSEHTKRDEDRDGWSASEGVSVWSTSLAILALVNKTNFSSEQHDILKHSVLWLSQQQDTQTGGWAYQKHQNCNENSVMTALALSALADFCLSEDFIHLDPGERQSIFSTLNDGFSYLKNNRVKKGKKVYWTFLKKPNCFSTIWMLCALHKMISIEELNDEIKTFYEHNKPKCIAFVFSTMPRGISRWEDEQIVSEGGAKYNKQKNYYSFSPALILQMLVLGAPTCHPKIINQIRWIVSHQDDWKIETYDQTSICTFTYAMSVSTIVYWHYHVGRFLACRLLTLPSTKKKSIEEKLFGVPRLASSPVKLMTNGRIVFYFGATIGLLLIIPYHDFLLNLFSLLYDWVYKLVKTRWVEILCSTIGGLILIVGAKAMHVFRRHHG